MELPNESNSCDTKKKHAVTREKLLSALDEIRKENFSVSDDTILDKMYVHLENMKVREFLEACITEVTDWVKNVMEEWNQDKIFYDVKKFAVRFIGLIGSFEDGFAALMTRNVLQDFENVVKSEEVQKDVCMFVPSVLSLKMCSNHVPGLVWIFETGIWVCAVTGFNEGKSMYAKRVCIQFLSTLLTRSSNYSIDSCKEVLALICKPLLEADLINIEYLINTSPVIVEENRDTAVVEEVGSKRLLTGAEFLSDLLSQMLSDKSWHTFPFRVKTVTVENPGADGNVKSVEKVKLISEVMASQSYLTSMKARDLELCATLVLLIDLSNSLTVKSGEGDECSMLHVHSHTDQVLFSVFMETAGWQGLMKHTVTYLSWCHRLDLCNCTKCQVFQSFLVNNMFAYLLSFNKYTHFLPTSQTYLKRTEDLIHAIEKACRSTRSFPEAQVYFASIGVASLSRTFKFILQRPIVKDIYDVFAKTVKSLHSWTDWQYANSLCIQLMSVISDTVDENHTCFRKSCQESSDLLLRYIIKLVRLKSFHQDTRVVVSLLQTLKPIVRINGLHLANHSTHMKPTLVFSEEIALLQTQLEFESWEIRDTSLEVFHTMLELSNIASWLFDNVFQETLLQKIFSMTSDDDSSYVRASALVFFARSGKLHMFGDIIPSLSLVERAVSCVTDDTMPAVRRAACELMTALYISDIPQVDGRRLCETMFRVTVTDLDWEVKTKCLQFWTCVVAKLELVRKVPPDVKCLSYLKWQKEDVTAQVVQLLRDLGDNGCLKAVWVGLNDECDVKVAEEAYSLVTRLLVLDEQWGFTDAVSTNHEEIEPFDANLHNIKLHPSEFFCLVKSENWKEILTARKNWIQNSCDDLLTILDHILNVDNKIDDWDHNVVDCD